VYVELLLTYRCNLNCDFCYQSPEKRTRFPDMSLGDAQAIESNIRRSFRFKPRIHLFGGEPTLNGSFREILKYFSDKGYRISMTTNGEDVERVVDDLLRAKGLKEVILSLNTMNQEKQLSLLDRFKERRAEKAVLTTLVCPINEKNQHQLVDIARRCEDSPASCITFQHTTLTRNYEPKMDFGRIEEQVRELKKNRFRMPVFFFPDIRPRDIAGYYSDPRFPAAKNNCAFSWFVLCIRPNGEVIPCDELDLVLGNAMTQDLREVWNNAAFQDFRRGTQEKGASHPICSRCCHRRYH